MGSPSPPPAGPWPTLQGCCRQHKPQESPEPPQGAIFMFRINTSASLTSGAASSLLSSPWLQGGPPRTIEFRKTLPFPGLETEMKV